MGGKFTESYNRFPDGRRAWMFQASDKAGWNFEKLFAALPGSEVAVQMCGDRWVGSASSRKRIREEFQPGDLVFLYQAESQKAVVGLARLASHGYAQRWKGVPKGKGTFFDLDWWMRTVPLPYKAFKSDPVLAGMEKARIAQGTISRVSEAEAKRLLAIIALDAGQRAQVEREWRFPAKSGGLATPTPKPSKAGGREDDPVVRRAIEEHSMRIAQKHYEALGYEVENTASTQPFDLRCRRDAEEVRVEVKGTRSDGGAVELTAAEVKNARGSGWRTDLFIVAKIRVESSATAPAAHGGQFRKIEAWTPNDEDLLPTHFRYTPPR
ncbi:protein NO VEIN domain-containing protein [Corallococcus sp. AS-1-6]|uniref:protein NO VEIN domain-containing protein n=1 Tax=Corallococcus sp. AS-1-6 TaxID=2874599 RepID=UPI001CBB84BE|nr:DUF3883 domain-containing protein [Corallococcus sp. AS-1-6]MBZ4376613.1 EVE domain-containing protein [Corallococcus sp. AS-1-6]